MFSRRSVSDGVSGYRLLKRQVLSIYPDFNHRIRPAYNKLIYPRARYEFASDSMKEPHFVIMWSRLSGNIDDKKQWSPNHFVPCVQKQLLEESLKVNPTMQSSSVVKPGKDNFPLSSSSEKSNPSVPSKKLRPLLRSCADKEA